ncbi:hypothetical protein [Maliponia aquimaris]|nr:hypothetical protein [Maliponia aquimaris]
MRVKPIADARNPEARLKDGQAPTQFWRAVNGEPDPSTHAAPPSIMQITISRMLDAQAPKPDAAQEPEPAPPTTRVEAGQPAHQTSPAETDPKAEPMPRAAQGADPPSPEKPARRSVFNTLP